jgi:hypothetical protein
MFSVVRRLLRRHLRRNRLTDSHSHNIRSASGWKMSGA